MHKAMSCLICAVNRRAESALQFPDPMLSTSTRWVVGATLTMAGALGVGRFVYTPLLPQMAEAFDWSFAQAGDVASANFFGYLVGAVLAPHVAYSKYVRLLVALSLMASAGTTYLGAEVTSFAGWLVIRFAGGIASALCLVVLTTHLLELLAREKAVHLGNIHFAGVGLGIMLCMGGVYLGGDVSTQWARQGGLAAGFMAIAWLALANGPWIPAHHNQSTVDTTQQERSLLWPLIVGYGFFGFGYVVSATFIVAMAAVVPELEDPKIVWLVVGAATVPSVYFWQWLAQRHGLMPILILSYLTLGLGTFLAGSADSVVLLMLAAIALGGTFGGITALGLSAGRVVAPHQTALAVSRMTVAFSLGQLLGPAFAGRMADSLGGFFWPSVLCTVLLAVSALLTFKSGLRQAQ
ncbi:MAG: YbfB/YjiJ family MFS transporter [Pseudomonadales bacterium]|nr:YbfB/YjiJ family MFS transporter [Pseudomonadales bacterium]